MDVKNAAARNMLLQYIKIYCKTKNGDAIFYKDVDTDIRTVFNGRFDYGAFSYDSNKR